MCPHTYHHIISFGFIAKYATGATDLRLISALKNKPMTLTFFYGISALYEP